MRTRFAILPQWWHPSGVPSVLRNATHGFIYTVSDSSGVQCSSGCVVVTLD
jgi:hypothetical protein